jgi:hypothetical protein
MITDVRLCVSGGPGGIAHLCEPTGGGLVKAIEKWTKANEFVSIISIGWGFEPPNRISQGGGWGTQHDGCFHAHILYAVRSDAAMWNS